ncbi:AaceriAGR008Wp [[Ashbya] aceris (nom. inval.)]|nr:AaceriAGR008Wp [[Ashbya] aceris (nom. inval.)]
MDLQNVALVTASSVLMFSALKQFVRTGELKGGAAVTKNTLTSVASIMETQKYPAKRHNLNVKKCLLDKNPELKATNTAIFISGEKLEGIKYCDQSKAFRQNRYFYYLSGCNIPASSLLFNFNTEELTLFLPDVEKENIMWSGLPLSIDQAYEKYDVDSVAYASNIEKNLVGLDGFQLLTIDMDDVPSKIQPLLKLGGEDLFYALDECRMIKDEYEIAMLRKACAITDKCHLSVMSAIPIEQNEGHMHAEFTYHAMRQGSKFQGYDPICCSGPNCGTLHYVKNDDGMEGKHSVLLDAGAEWENYTADVTRCFPINGAWTKEHREIYETVLDMQTQVMNCIKPGVSWDELHVLAHRVLIDHFLKLGIFKSEYSAEEILSSRASVAFFPHGLGHLLGMDTHDVGGNPNYDDPDPMMKYLRLRRPLQAGMVVTNEPGCYFNQFLIEEFLEQHPDKLKLVNRDVVSKYFYIGGVRIEDDVLVTETGHENLTRVTSDPDEIEKIVSDAIRKGRSHFHALA